MEINIHITNIGSQSAVEPAALLFKNDSYLEVIKGGFDKSSINYTLKQFRSLMPGHSETLNIQLFVTPEDKQRRSIKTVIEVIYKTIHGDLISDITELEILIGIKEELIYSTRYTTKRYRGGSAFEQMIEK